MSIRLLLVEDDPNFLEIAQAILADHGPELQVRVAASRDSAISALTDECFDYIVLDLKLPPGDKMLDVDVEHGRFVFESTQELAPGTPVLILTGSSAEGFIPDFLARSTQVDIWGDGTMMPTVSFLKKSDVDRLSGLLSPVLRSLREVRDIEVRGNGGPLNLTWEQDRLVRIFVRRLGGVSCTLFKISGGLSGAEVFRVTIANAHGAQILNSIMKIGSPSMVAGEVSRYNRFAQNLTEAATARLIEDVRFGGGRYAAVTYRLAETFTRSVLDLARSDPRAADAVVAQVSELLRPWRAGAPESRKTVGEIRSRVLNDDKAARLIQEYNLAWATVLERRYVQTRWCCVHGDLHGANILIDAQNTPILIDYGDMGEGPTALDWVTLELSLLFHPSGPARGGAWPDANACRAWGDRREYARTSPFADVVTACRTASDEACAGQREVAAAAYGYLLRQLSYDDTNKAQALALLEGVRELFESGT